MMRGFAVDLHSMGRNKSIDALTLEGAVKKTLPNTPLSKDNTPYSLRELVCYVCDYAIKSLFFKLPDENVFDLLKKSSIFTVACSCKAIHRILAKNKKNSASPPLNNFGVAVGGKSIVPDNHLQVCEGPGIEKRCCYALLQEFLAQATTVISYHFVSGKWILSLSWEI
jgi:hypothetical protein